MTDDEQTNKTVPYSSYCIIVLIVIGSVVVFIFGLAVVREVQAFVNSPVATAIRWLWGKVVPMDYSVTDTNKAVRKSAAVGKALSKQKDSMTKHLDHIRKHIAIQTTGHYLGEQQTIDSEELDAAGREFFKEGARLTALFHTGASQMASLTGKIKEFHRNKTETDLEYRKRISDNLPRYKIGLEEFIYTIRNTSTLLVVVRDKKAITCDIIHKKRKKYAAIHSNAAHKKSLIEHVCEYGSITSVGAAIGGAVTLNPVGAYVGSMLASGAKAIYHYIDATEKTAIAEESKVTVLELDEANNSFDAIGLFLTEVDKGFSNINSNFGVIQYDVENLEVSNGGTKFVNLIIQNSEAITKEYNGNILTNDIGYKIIEPDVKKLSGL